MKKSYYFVSVLLLTVLLLLQIQSEQKIDWRETYAANDSSPYAAEVLYNYLENQSIKEIKTSEEPIYNTNLESTEQIFIVSSTISMDKLDIKKMISFADSGGQVFLSARSFNELILDTFNLKLDPDLQDIDTSLIVLTLDNQNYEYNFSFRPSYFLGNFSKKDTSASEFISVNKSLAGTDYWIKKNIGTGAIHFHSFPYAFSNYFMMKDKSRAYVEKLIQNSNKRNYLWLQYYSTGRKEVRTPLRYLLQEDQLRKALYISVAFILLFMLFSLKRKAAAIPIIKNPVNASLDFIKTLGLLLFQQKKHRNIAIKRFKHFIDFNRKHYFIMDWTISERLIENLSKKSSVEYSKIKKIFDLYTEIKSTLEISKDDLISFNRLLEEYYTLNTYKKEFVS